MKDIFGLKVTHDIKIEKIREALLNAVAPAQTAVFRVVHQLNDPK